MLTKKSLEEYIDIKAEIHDLEERIKKQESEVVTDTVVGSSPDWPHTQHPVSIRGVQSADELRTRRFHQLAKLQQIENEIEEFIESLPKSRERRIARYRIIDGLLWKDIAAKMGHNYSETSVRRIFNNITNNF